MKIHKIGTQKRAKLSLQSVALVGKEKTVHCIARVTTRMKEAVLTILGLNLKLNIIVSVLLMEKIHNLPRLIPTHFQKKYLMQKPDRSAELGLMPVETVVVHKL